MTGWAGEEPVDAKGNFSALNLMKKKKKKDIFSDCDTVIELKTDPKCNIQVFCFS